MSTSKEGCPVWRLTPNQHAETSCGDLSGVVDLARHEQGFALFERPETPFRGTLWGWRFETPQAVLDLRESYVRGSDLIVRYGKTSSPFHLQTDWRIDFVLPERLPRLTQVVSVETTSLETHPTVSVGLKIASEEVLFLERMGIQTGVLYRLPGGRRSILGCVELEDLSPKQPAPLSESPGEGINLCTWRLFDQFLEKGVLRRARMTAFVLRRQGDLALANALYERFLKEPAPLTT